MTATHAHRPDEIAPEPHHWQLLPAAQFADSYRATLPPALAQLDAGAIAARMMAGSPAWVTALLDLRNRLVAPLGLKGARLQVGARQPGSDSPGFPVIEQSPTRMIMGMDDSHLDFRLCVEKSCGGGEHGEHDSAPRLTVTTVVHTKRWLGRAYLAAIMPFHRRIVRTLLARLTL